jgi:hypothetical protein
MTAQEFDGQVRDLLAEVERKQRRAPRYGFSDAAACARGHVYAFREWEATGALTPLRTPPSWLYQAAAGNGIGAALEEAARRLGWQTQVPVRWESDGLVVEGMADIVAPDFVLDGKWVRRYSWKHVQEAPKPEHWIQVHGYGHALGKPWVGVLYQQQKDYGEDTPWLLHQGETDPSVAAQVVAHWSEVDAHRKAGTLPVRPYVEPSFECARFCAYGDQCWSEVA